MSGADITAMNAKRDEGLAAARMAGHFGMLLTWLRTGVTPGAETLALCERALNDWRRAADAALAARLAEITGHERGEDSAINHRQLGL